MSRSWHHEHIPSGIQIGVQGSYTRRVVMINADEKRYHDRSFVLWFGAYGWTRLHVYADDLEDALERCAEWLAKYTPGLIMERYGDEHKELLKEVCDEIGLPFPPPNDANLEPYWRAEETANADMTETESGLIASWEWGVALEDPDAETLYRYICGE